MAARKLPPELLFDTATSLRLVDGLLDELRGAATDVSQIESKMQQLLEDAPTVGVLPQILLRAYSEIVTVLESLRRSRAVLERVTMHKLHTTHDKLREVSSATEMAATDMLDGLDRSLGLIDRLDNLDQVADGDDSDDANDEDAHVVRDQLREELHRLISCLQFQDITSQQLNYASSVLEEIEGRITAIVELFDLSALATGEEEHETEPADPAAGQGDTHFDPAASNFNSEIRQALADEIFG